MTQDWLWNDHYEAQVSKASAPWTDETILRIQRKRHIFEIVITFDALRYSGLTQEFLLRDMRRKFRPHYNLTSWMEKRQ